MIVFMMDMMASMAAIMHVRMLPQSTVRAAPHEPLTAENSPGPHTLSCLKSPAQTVNSRFEVKTCARLRVPRAPVLDTFTRFVGMLPL